MIDFVPNKNIVAVANDKRNGRITTSSVTFSLTFPNISYPQNLNLPSPAEKQQFLKFQKSEKLQLQPS